MTIELTVLALASVLGLVQILLAVAVRTKQLGSRWNVGPRDQPMPPPTLLGGRLERARNNFLETFPLFAAAVLVAHAAGRHDWMTEWGAALYLVCRIIYVPLYAAGVPVLRSIVWIGATAGIVLILLALL